MCRETSSLKEMYSVDKNNNNKNISMSIYHRLGILFFALSQNALAGGIAFGWASIDETLLIASVDDGGPNLTKLQTIQIFSLASGLACISPLPLGIILDTYGPRIAATVSTFMVALGCQMMSLLSPNNGSNFYTFAIGTCLIAFGGTGISSSVIHISNLFPSNENLVMSCLSGAIPVSFSVFVIFGLLWESQPQQFTYQTLFRSYGIFLGLYVLGSLRLYPDEPYEQQDPTLKYASDMLDMVESGALIKSTNDNDSKTTVSFTPPPSSSQTTSEDLHQHHFRLIEQPLDSYLREPSKFIHKSRSYLQSEHALQSGNKNEMEYISLKDQPFYKQLCSWTYLRAVIVFLVTSFFADFYVASMSTELADRQDFTPTVQHELARSFTLLMSLGLFVGIAAGYIIDRFGLVACTVLTILFGQIQMLCLVGWFDSSTTTIADYEQDEVEQQQHKFWMIVGFVMNTCFRQFLFPVYIGSLTAQLGFKYFGVLLGIGFAISGITKFLQASLVQVVQGTCHLYSDDSYIDFTNTTATTTDVVGVEEENMNCGHGIWNKLHIIQFVLLAVLLIVPILDHHVKVQRERHMRKIQGSPASPTFNYGAINVD